MIELIEAFCAQGLALTGQLGLCFVSSHVNPFGGGIALVNPLGSYGAGFFLSAARELKAIDAGYAHLSVDDASSNLAPPGPVPGALIGQYDSSSDIFGVQASFRWR